MLLNRLYLIMFLFILYPASLFAMEKMKEFEEITPSPKNSSLTIRCYEYCGVYTDISVPKEKPTWEDLKEALQVHQNNFNEPLQIDLNNDRIHNLQAWIPERYYNNKVVHPIIFYVFGNPDAEFIKRMYGDVNDIMPIMTYNPETISWWTATKRKCRRFFRRMIYELP